MGTRDEIRNKYSYLREGESTTGQQSNFCPCGKPSERCSLGVTKRNGVILYNCLSLSCSVGGGRVPATASRETSTDADRPNHGNTPPVRQFDVISRSLPDSAKEWLKQFNIGKATITRYGIGFHPASGRIVFPCLTPKGEHVQNTARQHSKYHPAKWLHEKGGMKDYIYTSRTATQANGVGIVVEDPISAIRSGSIAPTAALMGTKLSEKLPMLKEWVHLNNITKINLCLDADAYCQAGKIGVWLSKHLVPTEVKRIDKDVKWMTDAEIRELL